MARTVRVKLRAETMRLAGAWFLATLEEHPHLRQRFRSETLDFMTSLATRSGGEVKIDRAFAERFVCGWTVTFRSTAPHLLLQVRPYLATAPTFYEAIAEIVADVGAALRRRRGREPIDPIEAYEANERNKRNRRRSASGAGGCDYAHELAAAELGFKSKTAICEAITKGKKCVAAINQALGDLPPGSEHLFTLTDAHAGCRWGVSAILVPSRKQKAD